MKMQVNIARIEEIVGDDTDMKKTLLKMFIDTCDRSIFKLTKSLDIQGLESEKIWEDSSHELKGAALNLGFEDLGKLCQENGKGYLPISKKKTTIVIYEKARADVEELLNGL